MKISYPLVVGTKEAEEGTAAPASATAPTSDIMPIEELLTCMHAENDP
jgi:hypothetical protein